MFNNLFKIIYFIEFLMALSVRKIFTSQYKRNELAYTSKSKGDILFLILDGIGMIIPLIYVTTSWLDFADYVMPDWIAWFGTGLFASAIWILYKSHAVLGKYWAPTLSIQKAHELVSDGIYAYIRHPMYAAHLLWSIAQILMLHNWISGFSFFIFMVPHYLFRVKKEERMLIDEFGTVYLNYMKSTGRILPKL